MHNRVLSDDLRREIYMKFFLHLSEDAARLVQESPVRMVVEMEKAYWHYMDSLTKNRHLPMISMTEFATEMIDAFPHLLNPKVSIEQAMKQYDDYKAQVPTAGCIIIDNTLSQILLVKTFSNRRLFFPGGKINYQESPMECAIRETLEETGLNVRDYIDERAYLELSPNHVSRRQYIVDGVPRVSHSQPMAANEIQYIYWFAIENIGEDRHSTVVPSKLEKMDLKPGDFHMVFPYVKYLTEYVAYRKCGFQRPEAHHWAMGKAGFQYRTMPPPPAPLSSTPKRPPPNTPQFSTEGSSNLEQLLQRALSNSGRTRAQSASAATVSIPQAPKPHPVQPVVPVVPPSASTSTSRHGGSLLNYTLPNSNDLDLPSTAGARKTNLNCSDSDQSVDLLEIK